MNRLDTTGIIVQNPLRTGRLVYHSPSQTFNYSEYLFQKREKLRRKFYSAKRALNNIIKWSIVITSDILVGTILVILSAIIFNNIPNSPSNLPGMLGFSIGMFLIIFGIWIYDNLDGKFPTDNCDMRNKYRS